MPIITLRDLYVAELQDLLDGERQILNELPVWAKTATSSELRQAFEQHLEQTHIHAERLELLLRRLDGIGATTPCEAIGGLIREGRRRIAATERGDVLDAALIGIAQRVEHYEIAAYGCARTYAHTLGDDDARELLQQTLDEESKTDARLTQIAEHGINEAAAEDVPVDRDRQRARLRYIPATHLHDFKYGGCPVRNAAEENLGTLDGLVVDARSGQLEYFVVDSGGWFTGRRYLIPLHDLRPDESSHSLRTSLDRDAIQARPPFDPDAYERSTDRAHEKFQPPTWLMTGVWMTEASGFASVPPRAQCDFERDSAPQDTEEPSSSEPRIDRYRER